MNMEAIIIAAVSLFSSVIGAVCGIGGGVIIKPVLDAAGLLPVDTVSFLSGCTVLSMSVISVAKRLRDIERSKFDPRMAALLASGAVIGGLLGKDLYHRILSRFAGGQRIGAVQAGVLLAVTIGTLIYTINRSKVKTLQVAGDFVFLIIGAALGVVSAFLGIGGGPVNLVVLYYFFSMGTKEAVSYSLYIIMFSQSASLVSSIITGRIPEFSVAALILMVSCGLVGGIAGTKVNKKIREKDVDRLFAGLMVAMIVINIFNVIKYV